jgi:predicted nucleic acid-binding protein
MTEKVFVDTNILLYAQDAGSGRKHEIAAQVVRELWHQGAGVLSMQVLQEFYVNVTRKVSIPLSRSQAQSVVGDYLEWAMETTSSDIEAAFQIENESGISFWNALIVASAAKSGASRILSEDLNSGQRIAGVVIENPFVPSGNR